MRVAGRLLVGVYVMVTIFMAFVGMAEAQPGFLLTALGVSGMGAVALLWSSEDCDS